MVEVFWLLLDATKGSNTILPIHHPFWDQHRPGDRWLRPDVTDGNNCHCSLEATDEHPTAPPKGFELRGLHLDVTEGNNGPQPGLNEHHSDVTVGNNPAKTGRLFAQSHPYFPSSCSNCPFNHNGQGTKYKNQERNCLHCQWINRAIPLHYSDEEVTNRIKAIQNQAEDICKTVLKNDSIPFSPKLSNKRIKEWLNQPHVHRAEKNELILDIGNVFKKAVYKGWGPDKHGHNAKMHLFEIEILGDKSWIVVREFYDGTATLHSISDNSSILDYITNAK